MEITNIILGIIGIIFLLLSIFSFKVGSDYILAPITGCGLLLLAALLIYGAFKADFGKKEKKDFVTTVTKVGK